MTSANSASCATTTIPMVGIIGGIASGKSHVAAQLARRGANQLSKNCAGEVISADAIAHEVLETPEVRAALRQKWGDSVVVKDRPIDRAQLAARVLQRDEKSEKFTGMGDLCFLESLIHPRVARRIVALRDKISASAAPPRFIVLDAPLLLEAGLATLVQGLIFVETPDEIRMARARARGWSEENFLVRESRQWSLEKKRLAADAVISGTLNDAALDAVLQKFYNRIRCVQV